MMLSDRSIAKLIMNGDIRLDDYGQQMDQSQFQSASVDLRLDRKFIHRSRYGDRRFTLEWKDQLVLYPGHCYLANTVEGVKLPDFLGAIVDGKSTWGRQFLIAHSTAGYIDPGFDGQITLEISNIGEQEVTIHPGDRICQLRFFALTTPADRPYGHAELGSHYQGQTGPTMPHTDSLTTI